MKTNLGTGYIIEGFNSNEELYNFKNNLCIVGESLPYIYIGKTSEIPEVIAEECVYGVFEGKSNIKTYLDYTTNTKEYLNKCVFNSQKFRCKTPIKSIQSACNQPYCIIYKS